MLAWGSGGCQKGPFWGSRGAPGRPFGGLGVALSVHFGGLGVHLDAFGAQSSPKASPIRSRRPILTDFGAQREPKGCQNGSNIC